MGARRTGPRSPWARGRCRLNAFSMRIGLHDPAMDTPAQNEPPAHPRPVEHAAALADSVAATLRIARVLMDASREIDLSGLDQEAGRLCALALDLPPAEGRALRVRLIEVLAELDALA